MVESSYRETSLAVYADRFATASHEDAAVVREVDLAVQVNLRGDASDAAFRDAAMAVLSCPLPLENCAVSRSDGDRKVLWLGPDEWLIVEETGDAATLMASLREALSGQHVSLVDLGMNRLVIELSGARARDVLEKICLHDLHARAFKPGRVVGTVMFKTQVFLEQIDERPTYWLYVRPSFARHLGELLIDAMAEYAMPRTA